MNALAIRPQGLPMAPLGLQVQPAALDHALNLLDDGHGTDRPIDAAIYEAMGWEVDRRGTGFRRMKWWVKSPIALGWEPMPSPTGDERAAAALVPYRWSHMAGIVDGKPMAWCRENVARLGRERRYSECNRTTVARALTAAALFAHRQIVLGS